MSPDDKRYVLPDDILTASGFTCARCADPECRCIHFIFEDAEGKPILHAIISHESFTKRSIGGTRA